jgi:hypothetical protein
LLQNSAVESSRDTVIPTPSSPLRHRTGDEDEVALLGNLLLEIESNSVRKEQLVITFEVLEEGFVTQLEQVKDREFLTSPPLNIKPGIAYYIGKNVSDFKKEMNRRRAAEDLLSLGNRGAVGGQEIVGEGSGAGSGEDDEFVDFFVDY